MFSGLYGAATAMESAATRHEVAAENLANLQMTGFRRRVLPQNSFDSMMGEQMLLNDDQAFSGLLGTSPGKRQYDFTQGNLKQTSRPLDLAIHGNAFFAVEGANGPLYTRNGSFYVNPERQLVTIDGLRVLGGGGPIQLPNGASTETLHVSTDGRIYSGANEVGRLDLVRFSDPRLLESVGASLFAAPPEAGATEATAEVRQGFLAQSNGSSMNEMVRIIAASRHYEAAVKALSAIAESSQKRIGLR